MTPEERYSNFHEALKKESSIWYDGLPMVYPNKDISLAVKKVWLTVHAEGKMKPPIDWVYIRNLIQKTLTWQEPKNTEGFEKAVPVDDHPEALKGEERAKRLKEWQDAVAKIGEPERVHGNKVFHVAQQIKRIEYHPQSKEDLYKADRHLAWIAHCFNKVTAEPNQNFIPEVEFDLLYDSGLI